MDELRILVLSVVLLVLKASRNQLWSINSCKGIMNHLDELEKSCKTCVLSCVRFVRVSCFLIVLGFTSNLIYNLHGKPCRFIGGKSEVGLKPSDRYMCRMLYTFYIFINLPFCLSGLMINSGMLCWENVRKFCDTSNLAFSAIIEIIGGIAIISIFVLSLLISITTVVFVNSLQAKNETSKSDKDSLSQVKAMSIGIVETYLLLCVLSMNCVLAFNECIRKRQKERILKRVMQARMPQPPPKPAAKPAKTKVVALSPTIVAPPIRIKSRKSSAAISRPISSYFSSGLAISTDHHDSGGSSITTSELPPEEEPKLPVKSKLNILPFSIGRKAKEKLIKRKPHASLYVAASKEDPDDADGKASPEKKKKGATAKKNLTQPRTK